MKICIKNGTSEITEKKSRFIGNAFSISSEQDAITKINEIRKTHYNARHNCFAYIYEQNNMLIPKSSDDGEPTGTAGKPILDSITFSNAANICVVVTRYFGGILLGTGGLTRAYRECAELALNNCTLAEKLKGRLISYNLPYTMYDKFLNFCNNNDISTVKTEFEADVKISLISSFSNIEKLEAFVINETSNTLKPFEKKDKDYLKTGNNITLL